MYNGVIVTPAVVGGSLGVSIVMGAAGGAIMGAIASSNSVRKRYQIDLDRGSFIEVGIIK